MNFMEHHDDKPAAATLPPEKEGAVNKMVTKGYLVTKGASFANSRKSRLPMGTYEWMESDRRLAELDNLWVWNLSYGDVSFPFEYSITYDFEN